MPEVENNRQTLPTDAAATPSAPAQTPAHVQGDKAHCDSDTPAHPELKAPKEKTKGEKMFDLFTYTGVNYFANLGISVVIADMFLHDKGMLHNTFKKCRTFMNSGLRSIMNEKMAKEWSDIAAKTATLPLGGHLVMVPIKLLEDRKKRVTYWINSKFFPEEYEKKGIAIKPLSEVSDAELPEVVECPPKASWGNLINRRLLGWGTVIATNTLLDRNIHIGEKSFNHFVEDSASNALQKVGVKPDSRLDRYVRLTATDSYLTVITAFITRITNGTFFKKKTAEAEVAPAPADAGNVVSQAAPSDAAPAEERTVPAARHAQRHEAKNTTQKILADGPAVSHRHRASMEPQTVAPSL